MIKMLMTLSLLCGCACAGDNSAVVKVAADVPAPKPEYAPFSMDNNYFNCQIPKAWELKRDKEAQARNKIYEIELLGPAAGKAPVMIYAAYYAKDNKDFRDYRDFIERNAKDAMGRMETPTRKYTPVRESSLNGKKAFGFEREVKEFLHPEGSSDEFVTVREKFYVFPAKEGFHVLHYYAPKPAFARHLSVFKKMAFTFKGL